MKETFLREHSPASALWQVHAAECRRTISLTVRPAEDSGAASHRMMVRFFCPDDPMIDRFLPLFPKTKRGSTQPAGDGSRHTYFEGCYEKKDLFLRCQARAKICVAVYDADHLPLTKLAFCHEFVMEQAVTPRSFAEKQALRRGGLLRLPFYLLHGLLALCHLVPLRPEAAFAHGPMRLLKHADGLLRSRCGYGFSGHDRAFYRFEQFYQKACETTKPSRLLFTSRRPSATLGDNFDELQPYFAKEVDCFFPERPVEAMSDDELRAYAGRLAEAKVIVINEFMPELNELSLQEGTELVQLWHACGAFKQFGYARLSKPGGLYPDSMSHRTYTYAYTSSEQVAPIYAEAFGMPLCRVLPLGVPRTDAFFSEHTKQATREAVYKAYPSLRGKYVVLFAPTFRGAGQKDAYYPYEKVDYEMLRDALPDNAVILVRMHPFVKQPPLPRVSYLLDASAVPVNDLLFVTDLLITDYSSVIFEASLCRIPMLFYVYDREEYLRDRDIYFSFAHFAPGRLCESMEALAEAIRNQDFAGDDYDAFVQAFFPTTDGQAARRIAAHLASLMNEQA